MIEKNILIKDYLFEGNYIFGTFHQITKTERGEEVQFILDDGDIYSAEDLKERDYEFIYISSTDIINAFKGRFL